MVAKRAQPRILSRWHTPSGALTEFPRLVPPFDTLQTRIWARTAVLRSSGVNVSKDPTAASIKTLEERLRTVSIESKNAARQVHDLALHLEGGRAELAGQTVDWEQRLLRVAAEIDSELKK